jgi:SAM-dependent methyltransferase
MNFEDHFSRGAEEYARFRPSYPTELFELLASIAPARGLAWDCGTGNGQAALSLAAHFDRVVATDASADQIAHAFPHARVEYRVEPSEAVSLPAESTDLVSVAVAVHWFDLERFYAEVRRVLRPGGIIAVWTYHLPSIELGIDRVIESYYADILSGCWPEKISYLHERYRTLPFPFDEMSVPEYRMSSDWDLERLGGFLNSWSATRRYQEVHGSNPMALIWDELSALWGAPDALRTISWPLHIRVGRRPAT